MRKLLGKAWFRWLTAGVISGAFVFWLAMNGVTSPGGHSFFR